MKEWISKIDSMTDKEKRMPKSTKKSIKRASADVGLIFVCYNLRRIMNLVDKNLLKAYLKGIRLIFSNPIGQYKASNQTIFIPHPHHHFFQPLSIAA